ncbi:hypothetical protein C0J52_26147 [Blattella germanica]|nr:hypothetical protein C0J52_26147 [Blattella germanica]
MIDQSINQSHPINRDILDSLSKPPLSVLLNRSINLPKYLSFKDSQSGFIMLRQNPGLTPLKHGLEISHSIVVGDCHSPTTRLDVFQSTAHLCSCFNWNGMVSIVTCPGVYLCPNGNILLKVFMFETVARTYAIEPVFPLLYHQKMFFHKNNSQIEKTTKLKEKPCKARKLCSTNLDKHRGTFSHFGFYSTNIRLKQSPSEQLSIWTSKSGKLYSSPRSCSSLLRDDDTPNKYPENKYHIHNTCNCTVCNAYRNYFGKMFY